MKKKLVTVAVAVGAVSAAGVAWAALSGIIYTPSVVQFIATAGTPANCQSGSTVELTIPEPTWDNTLGDYAVASIDYANITSGCVSLGTADLILNITTGGSPTSIANGSVLNLSSTSGTIVLNNPLPFDTASNGEFNYIVRNS